MESESNKESQSSNTEISIIDTPREVSALTVGRMLGLATSTDLKLLEGKLDLLLAKVNTLTQRFEKLSSSANNFPSTSDLDRIEVSIVSLRNALKEIGGMTGESGTAVPAKEESPKRANRPNVFAAKPSTGE